MDVLFFASITKMKQPKGGSSHQADKTKSSYPLPVYRNIVKVGEALRVRMKPARKRAIARLVVSAAQRNGLNEVSSEHKLRTCGWMWPVLQVGRSFGFSSGNRHRNSREEEGRQSMDHDSP